MQFSVIFWNAGLAPLEEKNRDYSSYKKLVSALLKHDEADVVALCEVDDEAISEIVGLCKDNGYEIFRATDKVNSKSKFSMCVLVSSRVKWFEKQPALICSELGNNYRVAQTFDFSFGEGTETIRLYLCHWRSRVNDGANRKVRTKCGTRLRDRISELNSKDVSKHIIVAGDFNDDPYDESMQEYLLATRDVDKVKKKQELLYNPFWSSLGARNIGTKDYYAGTHFFKTGLITNWYTFDQILVSSSFIVGGNWFLLNENERIIAIPWYLQLVKSNKSKFDHLPVFCIFDSEKPSDNFVSENDRV